LPDKRHRIIQFVSSYKEEGASEVALETAIIAARLIGQRVLFIDTETARASRRKRKFPDRPNASLETLLLAGASPYEALRRRRVRNSISRCCANRVKTGSHRFLLNTLQNALESLCLNFDLIVVDSQAILSDAFAWRSPNWQTGR